MAEKPHAAAREPITTPLTTLHTGHESIDKVVHHSERLIEKISTYPVAHMIRAAERFSKSLPASVFGVQSGCPHRFD